LLKYLPAPLDKQIKAKLLISLLFTFVPVAVAITPVAVYMGVAGMLPVYLPVSFACILTASIIGILMDSISPYTVWSDELSALRGNLNCFFNLAAEMIAALAAGGLSYGLYMLSGNHVITILAVSIFVFAAGLISVTAGLPKAGKNIADLVP